MPAERRKPQTGKQLLIRFAEGSDLRDRLEQVAKANGRSTTAEVLLRLEASLPKETGSEGLAFARTAKAGAAKAGSVDAPDTKARLANLEKGLAALLGAIADLDNRLTQSIGEE